MTRYLFTYILAFLSVFKCYSQSSNYNINRYNGLASNHVYCTYIDITGYLWIGTDNGVYRYNGYTLKKYDYSDGLATTDVWSFYEDNKNRLWLQGISNSFGYIYNGNYKEIKKGAIPDISEIYPRRLYNYNNELVFAQQNYTTYTVIMRVKDDSLFHQKIYHYLPEIYNPYTTFIDTFYVEIYFDKIVKVPARQALKTINSKLSNPQVYNIDTPISVTEKIAFPISGIFAEKYFFCCKNRDSNLYFYNVLNNKNKIIPLGRNEHIIHAYPTRNNFYVITNKCIYAIDNSLKVTLKHIYPQFQNQIKSPENITYYSEKSFWGEHIIATKDDGLFINQNLENSFSNYPSFIDSFTFCGNDNNGGGYWWNNAKGLLLNIEDGIEKRRYHLPDIKGITKVVQVTPTKIFLNSAEQSRGFWLNSQTGAVSHFAQKLSVFPYDGKLHFYFRDFIFVDSTFLYHYSGHNGLLSVKLKDGHAQVDSVHYDRFNNILLNKKNRLIIGYTDDKIITYKTTSDYTQIINAHELNNLDLKGIEKIEMDDFGNMYIKSYDKLILYNYLTQDTIPLLKNFILNEAKIDLIDSVLHVAGTFGTLEIVPTAPGKTRVQKLYPNTKKMLYNFIKEVQFSKNTTLLVTDKGNYLIDKRKTLSSMNSTDSFHIIISADSIYKRVLSNDTLVLSQKVVLLDIDVIKPTGTGTLNIEYSINGGEYVNTGNQLIIPKSSVGKYQQISLVINDNTWKSEPFLFKIYVQPYWWQTTTAKNWFIAGSIILLLIIGYIIFFLSRFLVNKSNDRRNQRRELELKSIYSQINPHFIFNTLSTALYFVRKNKNKEALEHISQFSQLLRAYIKSSRNKYISIEEELENLHNYLSLQLTRFDDKFDYSFDIAADINPKTTRIPSLLLQPLVENALNHGIFHLSHKGQLKISFRIDGNYLICMVDDNGIGRKKSNEIRSEIIRKADSYGSILIEELVNTFNKYEQAKITLEYIDKEKPDSGTTVIIKIKHYQNV